ncbi:MAG: hypothetical protein K0Q49_207 [Haloplasmataceae bacterium]|jgi:hypothetical protein|nr:hypothetical protein [Haloplasmataceae bacterium]
MSLGKIFQKRHKKRLEKIQVKNKLTLFIVTLIPIKLLVVDKEVILKYPE